MIYKQGELNKITLAAGSYLNFFKKIVSQYLADLKQKGLLYDPNEIKLWLETLISSRSSELSLDLIKSYYQLSSLRPCVYELYHQHCMYMIAAKKCFEITQENDKEKVQKYCYDLLFKHINKTINSNLELISTIDFDKFTEESLDGYFAII